MLAAIALAVVSQVFLALGPLVQSVILDDAVLADQRPLAPWIALLIAVGVVSFVANYGRRRLGGRAAVDVQRDLQVAVHHHMQYLDPARRDQLRTGDVMSRATSDITLIQVFLQQLAMSIGSLALLASSLVIMLFLSPLLAVVVGVCVPLFAWLSNRFRTRSFPASWMDQRYQGGVAGVVEEAVTGVRIVKAFGQEQAELDLLTDTATTLYRSRMRSARITARYADQWDTFGVIPGAATEGVETDVADRIAALDAACREIGRDPAEIRRSTWATSDALRSTDAYLDFVRRHHRLGTQSSRRNLHTGTGGGSRPAK
jgi:ATP-binding cassette subfamily B protein